MITSISKVSYTHFQKPKDKLEVKFVQNTKSNLGGKHVEICEVGSSRSGLTVELPPFAARYVNFSNLEQARKFERGEMNQKFHIQLSTMCPSVLELTSKNGGKLLKYQESAIETLRGINDMCMEAMWENEGTLKKHKATIRETLRKQGVDECDIESKAWIAFLNGGQTGICEGEDGTVDIKLKCRAYRHSKSGDGTYEVLYPSLFEKAGMEQVDYETTRINRGAVICCQVRVNAYVTPNGAYGTTYVYVTGKLLKNGPEYSGSVGFSDWSSVVEAEEVWDVEPRAKRQKTESVREY